VRARGLDVTPRHHRRCRVRPSSFVNNALYLSRQIFCLSIAMPCDCGMLPVRSPAPTLLNACLWLYIMLRFLSRRCLIDVVLWYSLCFRYDDIRHCFVSFLMTKALAGASSGADAEYTAVLWTASAGKVPLSPGTF